MKEELVCLFISTHLATTTDSTQTYQHSFTH